MSSVSRVLVPMDGSPLSKQSLEVALSEYPEATVTVLHVIDPTQPGYSYPVESDLDSEPLHGSEAWYERSEELAERLFSEVRTLADDYDRTVVTETAVGDPGREIVDRSENGDIDQVVIGSHGRSEADRHLLGSVTETVVFRSPVRVLLVR